MKTHGMSGTPEYRCYYAAKHRCENPNDRSWRHYGGRGIEFRFSSFEEFYEHLGPRPPTFEIDRIDNDGHYEPGNVRWTTRAQNEVNRRTDKVTWETLRERQRIREDKRFQEEPEPPLTLDDLVDAENSEDEVSPAVIAYFG